MKGKDEEGTNTRACVMTLMTDDLIHVHRSIGPHSIATELDEEKTCNNEAEQ